MYARSNTLCVMTAIQLLTFGTSSSNATPPTVLLLGDDGSETQVQSALMSAGHDVVFGGAYYDWDGINPSINDFDVVVYLDGYSYGYDLQAGAEAAIDAFVRGGGGLVITEWATYDAYGGTWNPLIAALMPALSPDRDYGYGTTWNVMDATHQLAAWLPPSWADRASFSFVVPHVNATVVIQTPGGDPLLTYRQDLGGTVVHVNHDLTYETNIIHENALRVIVNAVEFSAGTPPEDCNDNGIPDSADFTNGLDTDLNHNQKLDGCEPDCNANAIPDDLDIGPGSAFVQVPFEFDTTTPAEWDFVQSGDGGDSGDVALPFTVSLGSQALDHFMMTSDGYVELYQSGDTPQYSTYGPTYDLVTRGDPRHSYLLAGFDDLDSGTIGGFGYRIEPAGRVTFYWETQTYADDDGTYMGVNIFQIVLSATGDIQWNFASQAVRAYDYELFSGVYFGYDQNVLYELMSGRLGETESWIFAGTQPSVDTDRNFNGIPDSCEDDCNNNGLPDDLDVLPPSGPGFRQVGQEYVIGPSFDWTDTCDTCQVGPIALPFPVTLSGQVYTTFVMTSDGFVELLRDGDTPYGWYYGHIDDLISRTGDAPTNPTHTYLLAAFDDLSSDYHGVCGYSIDPTSVRFYWNTETYEDSESKRLNEFSMTLYDDTTVRWDFYDADFAAFGYDLFTGIYLGYADQRLHELTRGTIPENESWLFSLAGFPGGGSGDENGNSIPDECEGDACDMNGDGLVTPADVFDFFACLEGPATPHAPDCGLADGDTNGTVDLADAAAFCHLFTTP